APNQHRCHSAERETGGTESSGLGQCESGHRAYGWIRTGSHRTTDSGDYHAGIRPGRDEIAEKDRDNQRVVRGSKKVARLEWAPGIGHRATGTGHWEIGDGVGTARCPLPIPYCPSPSAAFKM